MFREPNFLGNAYFSLVYLQTVFMITLRLFYFREKRG